MHTSLLILILTIVFWVSYPKSNFGQIGAKKVFAWKLAHMVSQEWWFLLTLVFWICFAWKLAHIEIQRGRESVSRMLILTLRLIFWNFKPISIFWANFYRKSWILYFSEKLVQKVPWGCDCKDTEERLEAKIKRITVVIACCSYIFIVAKSKNWQSTKLCWTNGIIDAITIFLIKKVLLQPNFETTSSCI